MFIIGQNNWQNKGPAHGPQQRKPRAHALAHRHQHSINPGNPISQNQCSTRPHRISSHPISFHSTLHQGQHKGRSNEICGLMHWHTYTEMQLNLATKLTSHPIVLATPSQCSTYAHYKTMAAITNMPTYPYFQADAER